MHQGGLRGALGADRVCGYSGARRGIGGLRGHWGVQGGVGAIRGVLRAGRECRYSGPEGI